ncbi:hypothetical protein RQN30_03695 [Arcanobacterium hippocoleae]
MQDTQRQTPANLAADCGGYIPGLDGLRALAVLSVIGYHIFPNKIRGGFLGVDIFSFSPDFSSRLCCFVSCEKTEKLV